MAVFVISFSIPFMLFPSKVYADVSGAFTYVVTGGNATITAYDVTTGGTAVTIPLTLGGYPVTSIGNGTSALNTGITSVTFTTPSNVTSIGYQAFGLCASLTSITLPEGLITIGNQAFLNDNGLTSISIPSTVTTIGEFAFSGCTSSSLTSITIPSSVTTISNGAFYGCSNLKTVTFERAAAPSFGTGVNSFGAIKSGAIAYVPAGTIGSGLGQYDSTKYPFISGNPLTLTESPADSPGSGGSSTPRPLTPDEWVTQNLDMGQLVNHYGATPTGFLGMLYDNSMLRIPDTSGLNYWNEQLTGGVFGANQVVEHFIFSDEIGTKVAAMSNSEFINFLYSTLFARVPDTEGYNNWLSYINSGFSKLETLKAFLNNEEWINICNMFNVTP